MDDIVKAAMAKWPHVPDCVGWLGLDERGDWYMRDDRVQAQGAFPEAKGSRIEHEALKAFIHRNLGVDALGQWFFQNGPQRVFIELANTPWVWRVSEQGGLVSSTGEAAQLDWTGLDESGRLYAHTPRGLGLVHSQDIWLASEHLQKGIWPEPEAVQWQDLPQRFGFVRSPQTKTAVSGH
jgi:Protein of unknown function (DUF2946)